jgi:hypothetical protein
VVRELVDRLADEYRASSGKERTSPLLATT